MNKDDEACCCPVLLEKCRNLEKTNARQDDQIKELEVENKHQSKMIYIGFGLAVAVNFIAPFFGKV